MSSPLNPQTAGDWGGFAAGFVSVVGLLWAIIWSIFKFMFAKMSTPFLTIEQADQIYVKKVERDGTALYARPKDLDRIEGKLDRLLEMAAQRREGDHP